MNSSIEIDDVVKLADKLIARTREGKLRWEAVAPNTESGKTAFTTALEGSLRATVSYGQHGQMASQEEQDELAFSLVEFDSPVDSQFSALSHMATLMGINRKDVLSVTVEKDPSYGYDSVNEKQLAKLLTDLYGLARRSALKIDGSVEKALTYLDRIAS